ncbi:MAG: hypothetical protein ACRCWG_02910 [Sarcina sp.]
MKKIELYLKEDLKGVWDEWDSVKPFKILMVEDNVDLWESAINLNNKFYTVWCSQGDKYKIRELEKFNIEETETFDEGQVKCPICGEEVSDSWELSDDEGECDCCGCGAVLEWNREVVVNYSAEVKEVAKPIKL